jgi:hypothetical protein
MLVLNKVSRYDVAKIAIQGSRKGNTHIDSVADKLLQNIDKQVEDFWAYIKENGKGRTMPNSLLLIADL